MNQIKNKKILIISLNAIGDSYLSSSVVNLDDISFLNNSYHIITLSDARFLIDEIKYEKRFYVNKKNVISIFINIFRIIFNKYDFVFSFFGGRLNTLFFLITRAKIKSGYINFKKVSDWSKKVSKLYIKGIKVNYDLFWRPEMNFMDRIKLALKPFNIDINDLKKPLFTDLKPNSCPTDEKIILINYDSKIEQKRIPTFTVMKLIEYLLIMDRYKLCLIDVNNKLEVKNITVLNKLNIDKIIYLLNKSILFITTDSFLLHIADAYNINTLGIFYETNPESAFYNYENKYWLKLKQDSVNQADLIFNKVKEILSRYENL